MLNVLNINYFKQKTYFLKHVGGNRTGKILAEYIIVSCVPRETNIFKTQYRLSRKHETWTQVSLGREVTDTINRL